MVRSPSDLLVDYGAWFQARDRARRCLGTGNSEFGNKKFRIQLGEWVEPNSGDEILWTLDQNAKHSRPPLLPEMYDSVGDGFVFRTGGKISVENTRCVQNTPCVRRITNPFYSMGICHRVLPAATEPAFIFGANYGCGEFSASFMDKTRPAEISHSVARWRFYRMSRHSLLSYQFK